MVRFKLHYLSQSLLLLLTLSFGIASLHAQEDEATAASRELRIKAAYLYQFGRYVQWPAKAFSSAEAPFVIGILKQDPIAAELDQLALVKKIENRPIQIRQFSPENGIPACHILFLSTFVTPEVQTALLGKATGKNILLVGDSEKFLDLGGAVRFVVEGNNVRLHIARKSALRQELIISSKLLQVARVLD
ncbi:MAG: YfiR family protein [Planctomycetota bacterium]